MRSKIPVPFILVCILLLIGTGIAQADQPVQARVLFDSGNRIVLDYDFGDHESRAVDIGGTAYQEIWFPSEPVSLEQGAPALPHVNRSVIIPDDAEMSLRVLASSYEEIFVNIAPSKGNLLRTVDPASVPYTLGPAYQINAFLPGPLATLGEPYILRDHRGLVVRINPFQYNPVTGVLRVYTDITVELTGGGPGAVNVLDRDGEPERPSRAFQTLARSHFLNYATGRYAPIDEEGEMLIISHDPWIANLAPFVAHKAAMGITATVVGVSTIGNTAGAIKAEIQSAYDSGNLAFVLLVGDIAEVASFMVSGGASDPSYSKLAGSDNYPEILVGRFSAGTLAQLETQIERTITYETAPAQDQEWFWKGTGIASSQGAGAGDEGQADNVHAAEIRQWLLGAGYTEVDEIYDPYATDTMVTNAINDGRGVVNYTGHGSPTSWGTSGFNNSDVNALVNDDMLPFIVSVACNNGEFESYTTCFAEAWMRATNNGVPTGAIGIYASSISQSWAPPMEGQDEFNLLLTDPDEPYFSYGALCFAGSSSMMDDYGGAGVEMFDTWIVFGDPSLRVVGAMETQAGMDVQPALDWALQGQAGGPFAPQSFQYTLTNLDNTPIDFAATVSEPWLTISPRMGMIPTGGSVDVTVSLKSTTRSFDNGVYYGTVRFINLSNHEGDTKRLGGLTVGIPVLQQQWLLDVDPLWGRSGDWQFGQPMGLGGEYLGYPDPTGGASGPNVYGVNLLGDYPADIGGPYYLTTNPVNLEQTFGATLRFQRWLNTEALPSTAVTIDAIGEGFGWSRIWQNSEGIAENAWSSQSFSIAAAVDGASAARVRWGYEIQTDTAVPCSGWNIDDVELWAVPAGTARIVLEVAPDALSWTSIQGAIEYDLVRGDLETLRGSGGDFAEATEACVDNNVAGTSIDFDENPGPGVGWWILVRGNSTGGPMSYQALYPSQVGLRDEEINLSGAACP